MKIFGKHIFRTIKARPLQPIIIMLIVTVCVAVMILSVALPVNIYRNERAGMGVDEWSADLFITLKSTSDVRLIFEEDVKAALEDKCMILGEFGITGFADLGDDTPTQISVGAYDLEEADAFYDIRYIEYGKFTNNNLENSAIVSEWFAESYDLSLGDVLHINVLGNEFSYTVQAIAANTGVFNKGQMLVDISSVRAALSERSPIIASLSTDFNPYTKIHVKVNDGYSPEQIKAELESLESFGNKKIDLIADSTRTDYFSTILIVTVLIPSILMLIVAAMMIMSTFDLMQKKRQADIALFKIVGADSRHLNSMLYVESLIYAAVGGVLGSVLSIPLMHALNKLYGFKRVTMKFGFIDILLGFGSAVLFTVFCTYVHIRKVRSRSLAAELAGGNLDTDRHFSLKKLLYGIPSLILLLVMMLLPPRQRFIPAFLLVFALVAFIYIVSPYIIGCFASLVSRILSRARKGCGDLVIASRSCENSYPLRHAGRIMTVLVTIFASMTFILSAVEAQLEAYVTMGKFDYVGIGMDDETKKRIQELDGVVTTAEAVINRNVVFEDGLAITGISVDGDKDACFNDETLPDKMPVGDELVVSVGLSKMMELKIGDRVKCTIGGVPCEFTVGRIVSTYGDFVFYDNDYVGSGLDMTCIRTDGSYEAKERIMALCDERGVNVITYDEFFAQTYDRLDPQITIFKLMFYLMIIMTVVGICNVLAEQRIARLRDFEIIKQNGKTRKGIVGLQAAEVAYLLTFALLMSALFSLLICRAVNVAAISFGMTMYV